MAGAPGMGAYGASKHALEIVSSSLRAELYGWGVHVGPAHSYPIMSSHGHMEIEAKEALMHPHLKR